MAAEAAIATVVRLLSDLLIDKVKSLRYHGVERKIQLLKQELKRMQSFLKDANKKQAEDERMRNWISEIREVAQDAQDTIEIFLLNIENTRRGGGLRSITGFVRRLYHLNRIEKEIESLRARLDAIDKSRERYGIKDLGEVLDSTWRSQVESRRRLCAWQKDEHLVGMKYDVKKLLQESILDGEKKGLWISVVEGMGGIGKSTLARAIYNHRTVATDRFERRGWVVVSSEFTPQETIKQLLFQLPRSEQDKKELLEEMNKLEESMKDKMYLLEELKQMLHKQLEGKSYFIVLDDVWEKEHLEALINDFPHEQDKRSRLLVTTRNKIVTNYNQYVHKMKLLDPEKSWELLLKKAFISSGNGKCLEELEGIGRQIVEKCHGLPLAISVVGGLLVETQTKSGWEQVFNQINSYLGRAESIVSTVLELSYLNLSPQLKSCFLYLAFFKEDSTIPTRRLVDIWVAQGLVQEEGSRTTDEIARGYLIELINRSVVQVEDLTIDDQVKNCRLHDLVREVCLRKAKEEIGFEIVKGEEATSSDQSSYKPRHRVVYGKILDISSLNQNKNLRSLFLLNANNNGNVYVSTPSRYWKSFQLLKILDLDGFCLRRLPDSFRLLIGLKCLRMHKSHNSLCDKLELPGWLDNLKKLEVLCVENQSVMFPNAALKMEQLRHFHIYGVTGRAMKVENWTNIESLKRIRVEDWVEYSSRLVGRCRLRKLGIRMNGRERWRKLRSVKASLEKKTNLVELHLESITWFSMENIIPHLDSLTILKVSGGILKCSRVSRVSVFPPNLSHLTLEAAYLNGDPMQELGKLPKLQYLTLLGITYEYWRMEVLHDGFPCLEALSIHDMFSLTCIHVEEGGIPRLKQLRIHGCPNLQTENLHKHIMLITSG